MPIGSLGADGIEIVFSLKVNTFLDHRKGRDMMTAFSFEKTCDYSVMSQPPPAHRGTVTELLFMILFLLED